MGHPGWTGANEINAIQARVFEKNWGHRTVIALNAG